MRAATLRYVTVERQSQRWARNILHTLERHYGAIESELSYSPPDSIGVILYTQQVFADITQVPNWVGALNDGRIRVPVQGLSEVTPELSRVLKHELTHSFVSAENAGPRSYLDPGRTGAMDGGQAERSECCGVGRHLSERSGASHEALPGRLDEIFE